MLANELNFGIPNVQLPWSCGGTVNPSCFVGHQLVVLFLPVDPRHVTAELDSYDARADEFGGSDAWFLAIGQSPADQAVKSRTKPIAMDRDGAAWQAFNKLAKRKLDRAEGAAFLFTRGGSLHRVWPGRGHAPEVFAELVTRA